MPLGIRASAHTTKSGNRHDGASIRAEGVGRDEHADDEEIRPDLNLDVHICSIMSQRQCQCHDLETLGAEVSELLISGECYMPAPNKT